MSLPWRIGGMCLMISISLAEHGTPLVMTSTFRRALISYPPCHCQHSLDLTDTLLGSPEHGPPFLDEWVPRVDQ